MNRIRISKLILGAILFGTFLNASTQSANAASTVSVLPTEFTWIGPKNATLATTTGWTQIVSNSYDDELDGSSGGELDDGIYKEEDLETSDARATEDVNTKDGNNDDIKYLTIVE